MFARIASDLANPLVIPLFVLGIMGYETKLTVSNMVVLLGISAIFYLLIPGAIALFISTQMQETSLDFPRRSSRTGFYATTILSAMVGSYLIVEFYKISIIQLTVVTFFINLIFTFLINFRWKISVHSAALTTGGTCLLLFGVIYPDSAIFVFIGLILLFIILPVVFWSRFRLNVHSPSELLAGIFTGLILTGSVFLFWHSL